MNELNDAVEQETVTPTEHECEIAFLKIAISRLESRIHALEMDQIKIMTKFLEDKIQ